jgi:sugar/nucleoside kinase (ribokinase family)
MTAKRILGIGNALMDVVVKLSDEQVLAANNLPKGSMTLVDVETSKHIDEQTERFEKLLTPGGSVANSVHGLAQLGAQAGFIGKVGTDELGSIYFNELMKIGAIPELFKSEQTPTGRAMALVTPDGERTFGTFLGAAIELTPADLTPELFDGYDIAYIEGYLVQNHDLIRKAVYLAKEAGMLVALDLASYNVVEQNIDFLKEVVTNSVDILFANEDEAKAFTGKEPEDALIELSELVDIAVIKIGSKGSLIKQGSHRIHIEAIESTCVDTTGAGDLFASGFLYGVSKDLPLERCGQLGAITAGHVIRTYGARMDNETWSEIRNKVAELK